VAVSAIPEMRLAGLILVSVGAFTGMALFWAFCTPLLPLEQRPASIALISTAGILMLGIITIVIVSRTCPKHVSAR
jgi:hypothetical protein